MVWLHAYSWSTYRAEQIQLAGTTLEDFRASVAESGRDAPSAQGARAWVWGYSAGLSESPPTVATVTSGRRGAIARAEVFLADFRAAGGE